MKLNPSFVAPPAARKGISRFTYQLVRADSNDTKSLIESGLHESDPIVISSEQGHIALSIGFIESLTPSAVTVYVDKPIVGLPRRAPEFEETDNQDFVSQFVNHRKGQTYTQDSTLYRIDKDEMTSGMSLIRDNLVSLFTQPGSEKMRRLIVDLEPPFFSGSQSKGLSQSTVQYNQDQRCAIQKVLSGTPFKW